MKTYFVVVETSFYGPRLGFNIETIDEDSIDNIFINATDYYKNLRENDDVPYEVLYKSIQISEASTIRPAAPDIKW